MGRMTSDEAVRWGIVATGNIAQRFVQDLALVPDATALAVASRRLESARAFADEHGIDRAYGDWAELADDPDIEIVYVATPNQAHHEVARMMLDAGKAVLCEKPVTLNAAQAADLAEAAAKSGVFLAEAMWTRTIPAIRRAVELIEAGAIGEPRVVTADFSFAPQVGPEHRLRNPELGGGALLDVGVYPLALAQLFLGSPEGVVSAARLTPEGVDEVTSMLLTYAGGAQAALTCAFGADGPVAATIAGSAGRIHIPRRFHHSQSIVLSHGAVEGRVIEVPFDGNGLRFPAIEAGRCLRAGLTDSPLLPFADTLSVMRTMDEIRRQIGVAYPGE